MTVVVPSEHPRTVTVRALFFTVLAMIAFAANSILCRLALKDGSIDAVTFTSLRLTTGAAVLYFILRVRGDRAPAQGGWASAVTLFAYAAAFSFAYVSLPAGTGALLLFGAVQATMVIAGLRGGETLSAIQSTGLMLAIAGLVGLVLPGIAAPPLFGAVLMIGAGIAWGLYSLRGRSVADPVSSTAANFVRAAPLAALTSAAATPWAHCDARGAVLAVMSGTFASGLGYILWYAALPGLTATRAAAVQLSVPAIAALGGIAFLGETVSARLVLATCATLGGIALVIGVGVRRGFSSRASCDLLTASALSSAPLIERSTVGPRPATPSGALLMRSGSIAQSVKREVGQ